MDLEIEMHVYMRVWLKVRESRNRNCETGHINKIQEKYFPKVLFLKNSICYVYGVPYGTPFYISHINKLSGGRHLLTGKQLKLLRIEKDLNAKHIAEQLEVSKPYISILERGKQSIPDHIYKKWITILKGDKDN